MALIRPAREVADVEIAAVAARDPGRARRFADKHGIAAAHTSYDDLLADPQLDAIYNPLPNGLHCEWTIRALEAGKHVLCEKPMANNAAEAERMAEAAEKTGRVLAEAFHWQYHPLAARMREVIDSGALGAVRHVEATLCIPFLKPGDIRFDWDLGGGATMDTGCYTVNAVRYLARGEPEVRSAEARLLKPKVDRWMRAELAFPGGVTGRITCALLSATLLKINATVRGDAGEMSAFNFVAPQIYHRLTIRGSDGRRTERVPGDASYTAQLKAFAAMVRGGAPMPTDARDAVRNMRVIDAIYEAAGLPVRGT